MANPGTTQGAGRLICSASTRVNSSLLTGSGPVALSGPETVSCSSAQTIAPISSSREIHGQYWVPGPSFPPSPNWNSGLIRPISPPDGESTRPVRTRTTRAPPSTAGLVAASQSRQRSARKPVPAAGGLVDGHRAGVAVPADRRAR